MIYMSLRLIETLINIIYPARCLACGFSLPEKTAENLVCKACYAKIKFNLPKFCQKCGRGAIKEDTETCSSCLRRDFYFDRAFSACIFQEPLKKLIHLFKYNLKLRLRKLFVSILAQFVTDYHIRLEDYELLLAVPMHRVRLKEREINHSELLARQLGKQFNIAVSCDKLIRIHNNSLQTGLKFKQRTNNVKGAFSVKDPQEFINKNILIIDDVFTTGSTVSEIAHCLKKSQANRVDVLTLARTGKTDKPQ